MERIQKILASRGVCSRRHAEQLIQEGRVTCNGQVCRLGDAADPDQDVILLDGKQLPSGIKPVYIMLHKPRGYVTTLSDEKGRPNAAQLVADCNERVYPVGRLDMDSEGLLLFTNDGEFANSLMHPKHQINKVYLVYVKGYSQEGMERLTRPIRLDGYLLSKPEVKFLQTQPDGTTLLQITIHEGRNRQIRRMCAISNMKVKRLIRISEGDVTLGQLPLGKWRYLTEQELKLLRQNFEIL